MNRMKTILIAATLQLSAYSVSIPCMAITTYKGLDAPFYETFPEMTDNSNFCEVPCVMNSDELILTKLTRDDLEPLSQLVLKGGLGDFFTIDVQTHYDSMQNAIDDVVLLYEEDIDSSNILRYVIRDSRNHKALGEIYASFDEDCPEEVEISYWISAEARGHGYAYKASSLFIKELLSSLPISEVKFRAIKDNVASIKTIEKIINDQKGGLLKSFELLEQEMVANVVTVDELENFISFDEEDASQINQFLNIPSNETIIVINENFCSHYAWPKEASCTENQNSEDEPRLKIVTYKTDELSDDLLQNRKDIRIVKTYTLHF